MADANRIGTTKTAQSLASGDGEPVLKRHGTEAKALALPSQFPEKTRQAQAAAGPIRALRVEQCGRPSYANGLCQTHHRQMRTSGELKSIRRYRKRRPDTVKFSGLRLTRHCIECVEAYAEERGLSSGAAIAEILESWNEDS